MMMEAGRDIRRALGAASSTVLVRSTDGSRALSGEEILARAQLVAGALWGRGLQGRRIGLYYPCGSAALEAFIAVELLGATAVLIDRAVEGCEAWSTFVAGGVSAVLIDHPLSRGADQPPLRLGTVDVATPTVLVHGDLIRRGILYTGAQMVEPDRPFILHPRAVSGGEMFSIRVSYGNVQRTVEINQEMYRSGGYGPRPSSDECLLTAGPLTDIGGLVGSLPFLHLGLPQVLLPKADASAVLDAMSLHRITTLVATPEILSGVADAVVRTSASPLASLRRVLYRGAPADVEETWRLVEIFGPILIRLWGRPELGWPLTVLTPADHQEMVAGNSEVAGSCGRRACGVELETRPAQGSMSGLALFSRSAMVSPDFVEPDGWSALGESGYFTANEYLHLDRRDAGLMGADGLAVRETIRDAILTLESVSAAAVSGDPNPDWGQTLTVHVVSSDPGIETTLPEQLRNELPPCKIPKVVHRVDRLPRSAVMTRLDARRQSADDESVRPG